MTWLKELVKILLKLFQVINGKTVKLKGLFQIADSLTKLMGYPIDYLQTTALIRQIHIATGCRNFCTHCFADPAHDISQMSISSFSKISSEIGKVVEKLGERIPFLFLGSETDPSMVVNFAKYIEIYDKTQPIFVPITIFTHGWDLRKESQKKELGYLCKIYNKAKKSKTQKRQWKIVLSYDSFNIFARENWETYLKNLKNNIIFLKEYFPINLINFEIYYPLDAPDFQNPDRISYWSNLCESPIINNDIPNGGNLSSNITLGMFWILKEAGIEYKSFLSNIWDCGKPFKSGRANNLYRDGMDKINQDALQYQRTRVLYRLENLPDKFFGIMLYPNGSVRTINYLGYIPGDWLSNGEKVVSYVEEAKY
jgi:hypothetical protein